jgi:CubicO group peptidase (beta-lactamase class C family)
MSGYVDRGELPGLVALVARDGDVHVDALGTMAFGGSAPMTRDAIFRIASISKPITAAAAMILLEECRLRLDDAIDRWLPELANRRVLTSIAAELDATVPAQRAITVRDLLTSTMGFGSIMAAPDTYPIQRAIRDLRIGGDGPKLQSQWPTTDEWLRNLGSLPLLAQPGERWMYHVSLDVLGALIGRVAGQPLGAFLRERIFEPLGMKVRGSSYRTTRSTACRCSTPTPLTSSTAPPPARGAPRRRSSRAAAASWPRSTTTTPSAKCCSPAARRSSLAPRWS